MGKTDRDALAYMAMEASEGPVHVRASVFLGGTAPLVTTNERYFDVYLKGERAPQRKPFGRVRSYGHTVEDAIQRALEMAERDHAPEGPWTYVAIETADV